MAPKVTVPADFGRHHIGAPSHGNLTFNLGDGAPIKANSIILSLNSPVIDDLTTNLHLTSLEAEDFSREAVDCFIEASYTGEVEAVNVGNFRDVNKMSRVFEVSWLVARCEEYFVSYLDKLDSESSYSDMLFAVEEAVYLMSAVKKRDFLDLVVKKMSTISVAKRDSFIKQYLGDLVNSSNFKIDACVAIVMSDVYVMVEVLILHLENQNEKRLDDKTRYILGNINLTLCYQKKPDIHSKLYSVLGDLQVAGMEDFQLLLAINQRLTTLPHGENTDSIGSTVVSDRSTSESSQLSVQFLPYSEDFRRHIDFEIVLENLASNQDIQDLYTFIDGLWCRLYQGCSYLPTSVVTKITAVRAERNWDMLKCNYVDAMFSDDDTKKLIDPLKASDQLVLKNRCVEKVIICEYLTIDEFVKAFFKKDSAFNFQLSDYRNPDQQFVLKTTAMKGEDPDTFRIKYGFLDSDSKQEIPKLHFAIEAKFNNLDPVIFPLAWCGKPTCDKSKTYWNWGYIFFHNMKLSNLNMMYGSGGALDLDCYYGMYGDYGCRLVAFVI